MPRIRIEADTKKPRDIKVYDPETGQDFSSFVRAVNVRIGPENHFAPVIALELLDAEIIVDGQVVGMTIPADLPRVNIVTTQKAESAAVLGEMVQNIARDTVARMAKNKGIH